MTQPARSDRSQFLIAALFALALFAYHLVLSTRTEYGYFIDELYYIACSRHLAFGYVDHPPLSIILLALNRRLLGDSLPALRLLPALAMAMTVFITGMITRRLGGTQSAVFIASLAVIAMPVYLVMGSFYSMNALEIVLCATILYLTIRLLESEDPRYWVAIGVLFGLGLEMKHTIVLYGITIVLGLLLTPARRLLWNRWFGLGVFICCLLLLPNLVWQFVNGFPSVEFYRNAMVNKNIPRDVFGILGDQILFANPFALPLWIGGLLYLCVSKGAARFRSLGWTYGILLFIMILSRSSRADRIAAIYPVLFAGGAALVQTIIHRQVIRHAVNGALIVLLIAGLVIAAPLFTPVLSPPAARNYIAAVGLSLSIESGKTKDPLPQWLGDRLGWRELATEVARVYHALPPEEQRNTVIVTTNYGGAGALELYGTELGLPPVFATHNSYHTWGPPADSVRTYIGVFVSRRDFEQQFESIQEAGIQTCEYCTRPQQRVPIYLARGPRFSVTAEWPGFKIFD
jgi:4-amino-4-deoxy-L-arabinose transferase-like glycosyltransferase